MITCAQANCDAIGLIGHVVAGNSIDAIANGDSWQDIGTSAAIDVALMVPVAKWAQGVKWAGKLVKPLCALGKAEQVAVRGGRICNVGLPTIGRTGVVVAEHSAPVSRTTLENCLNKANSGWRGLIENPYHVPVSRNVLVVDSCGNAIVVPKNHTVTGSPDGRWIQVRNSKGAPTGLRKDGPHSIHSHKDPRAHRPHGHVPGQLNEDGTPWLTIKH